MPGLTCYWEDDERYIGSSPVGPTLDGLISRSMRLNVKLLGFGVFLHSMFDKLANQYTYQALLAMLIFSKYTLRAYLGEFTVVSVSMGKVILMDHRWLNLTTKHFSLMQTKSGKPLTMCSVVGVLNLSNVCP